MQTIDPGERATSIDADELRRMVGPDPHRRGRDRYRLLAEQVPVWAIIGHIGAVAGTTDPEAIADDVIADTAAGHGIGVRAVQAALLYYAEHRCAVDTLLEANGSAPD